MTEFNHTLSKMELVSLSVHKGLTILGDSNVPPHTSTFAHTRAHVYPFDVSVKKHPFSD